MAQVLTLPDGRKLDYLVSGAEKGLPLVYLQGTPGGSYVVGRDLQSACERKNLRLVSFTRAGYGGSSRNRGRRVVDVVADIHALLKHLGHEECIVAGYSGGGPHALACAARLPGCLAALCICSAAPYDAEGLDFFAGFGEDNVEEFNAALEGEEALTRFCEAQRPGMLAADAAGLVGQLASLLPAVDRRAVLESPGLGEDLVRSFREGLRPGVGGWVDDDLAFTRPWGFALGGDGGSGGGGEVRVPVLLYQGDEDLMVPPAHGRWLAGHLPREWVRPHLMEGEGHVSILLNHLDAMLDELVAAARSQRLVA